MHFPLQENTPATSGQAQPCDMASDDGASSTGKPEHAPLGLEGRRVSRSRLQRLGIANSIMVSFGFVISILFSVFVVFVWSFSPGINSRQDDKQPTLWRRIVLSDWLAASITLSSAILRTCLGMQAAVATSVIAADSLERSIVPLRLAPLALSISASGWNSLWSSLDFGWQMAKSASVPGCLLIVLLLTSIASQFTSTLLVADLGTGVLLEDPRREMVAYGVTESDQAVLGDGWTLAGDFPRFAEWSDPPASKEGWVTDTGPSLRAILPFNTAAERSALNTYKGFATVIDTRFSCMAPGNASMYLQATRAQELNGTITAEIPAYGNFSIDGWPIDKPREYQLNLDLRLALGPESPSKGEEAAEWTLLLYMPTTFENVILDSPMGRPSRRAEFIVLNVTGTYDSWNDAANYFGWLDDMRGWSSDKVVIPWRYISHTSGISIGMSLCFGSYGDLATLVDIRDGALSSEPKPVWDPAERQFNQTDTEMLHVGAFYGRSLQDRGVLSLQQSENWAKDSRRTRHVATDSIYHNKSKPLLLCTYCQGWEDSRRDRMLTTPRIHPILVGTVQSILKSTGSLPLAMQTLWTVAAQRSWYNVASRFEVSGHAAFSVFGEATMPRGRIGLAVVLGIIAVHNIAVAIVLALFLVSGRHSRSTVGNLWQGFGQMAVGDVGDLAIRSSEALDKEVMAHLKIAGDWDSHVGLLHGPDGGIQLRKKPPHLKS
ncbi:hypothetical protein B0T16DRAFT_460378 [Cercophora newfieldiana]|uniref:Uncharacterized protein n=1 Tax=Cercophora newfieldiana TaxID=92897 RepID=A0AA39Y1K5_9PEZI|nr:hypothetical protein B0T16DRAFT_460378 [Cercophora newfieldiana]